MLAQILRVSKPDLNEAVLSGLVAARVAEWQRLEFKAELPGKSDAAKKEFTKDVVAMINGGGGLIIYGVQDDKQDRASGLKATTLKGEVSRLQQLILTRIEPYLHVDFHEVEGGTAGEGYLVLELRPSARFPHAARVGNRLGFHRRVLRNTVVMNEAQVADVYRTRFDSTLDRTAVIDGMLSNMSARMGSVPSLWVAAVPTAVGEPLFRLDQATQDEVRGIAQTNVPVIEFERPTQPCVGFRCFELAASWLQPEFRRYPWIHLGDEGQYLHVRPITKHQDTHRLWVNSTVLYYLGLIDACREFSRWAGVAGELVLHSGIRSGGNRCDLWGKPPLNDGYPITTASLDVRTRQTVELDQLFDGPTMVRLAKTSLEQLLSVFGCGEIQQLLEDGSVRGLGSALDPWLQRNGIVSG